MKSYNTEHKTNEQKVSNFLKQQGLDHFGFCELKQGVSFAVYKKWIEESKYGEMHYLKQHLEAKAQPKQQFPKMKSLIVVAHDYNPHPAPVDRSYFKNLKIAKYAKGEDYHYWFKEKLEAMSKKLQEIFPHNEFLCFTDSAPILERDYAYQSGLGWVGKNTCLIHPKKGSFFFLGEILTDLVFSPQKQVPDRCGTCTRCIDACPTGALSPRELDANKCISHWNIEAKSFSETNLASWYFGCDICQDVCPWNEKIYGKASYQFDRTEQIKEIKIILESSHKQLERYFKGTPLLRARAYKHKINALLICVEHNFTELIPSISAIKSNNNIELNKAKSWALDKLS